MHKFSTTAFILLAAGMLLPANFVAQQTPAGSTQTTSPSTSGSQTSSANKPATSSKTSTAKKPATAAKSAAPLALKTDKDKFSYALGMRMGASLKKQEVPVDPAILQRGLKDALAGNKLALSDQEAQAAMMKVQNDVRQKQEAKMQAEGAANKKQGEDFLAANKSKEGVVALPSGLQYKVLKEGTGPKPAASDSVECNYRGTLIDGKEFDSSYKRGQPATFPVSGVIKGWTEALQLMPVGSKWQLYIPSDLAYGERGAGGEIGPNSTLIFEVELLNIKAPEKTGENSEKKPDDASKKPDKQ
jgi:FKBP-type peptidyl-prolyl cis-trans isomerase FklB